MPLYEISINAENDLREIAQYKINKWDNKIFEQYRIGLIKTFDAIANKEVAVIHEQRDILNHLIERLQ